MDKFNKTQDGKLAVSSEVIVVRSKDDLLVALAEIESQQKAIDKNRDAIKLQITKCDELDIK
jgi:hypothetical protein